MIARSQVSTTGGYNYSHCIPVSISHKVARTVRDWGSLRLALAWGTRLRRAFQGLGLGVVALDTRPDHENYPREVSGKALVLETGEQALLLPVYAIVLERTRHVLVRGMEGPGGCHRGPVPMQNEEEEKRQSLS